MKLISLKLKNFKGIKPFELQANGENITVFGDNATGKTTLFDAFIYLLFGKDSQGRSDFEIKTLDKNGQVLHGLDHEVEGLFNIDGRPLTLRKVFAEKWTKKRGQVQAEFTGHSTDYFINGVPVQKKEYDAKISEIADENIFKLLTSPTYFNTQLHWQERRKTLLDVCGDISDEDVINSNESLKRLPEILQGRKIDEHRKVIAARRAAINDELIKIPVRIDEAERALPDVIGIDVAAVTAEIKQLESAKQQKERELITAQNGGEIAEKTKELRRIEAELLELENQFTQVKIVQSNRKQEALNDAIANVMVIKRKLIGLKSSIEEKSAEVEKLEAANAKRRNDWSTIKSLNFEFEQAEICPTCGRPLPAEELAAARETAEKAFNLDKSEKLEKIVAEGKEAAERIKTLNNEITEIQAQITSAEEEIKTAETKVAQIQAELNEVNKPSVRTTPSYITKEREQAAIIAEIEQIKAGLG